MLAWIECQTMRRTGSCRTATTAESSVSTWKSAGMAESTQSVRPLMQDDLEWVLDLSGARRERIVDFAPRFWRPAPQARHVHGAHLSRQIANPEVISVRTDHGFLLGPKRGERLDIDDMALDDDSRWSGDGYRLLRAAAAADGLRFVCPVPEPERTRAAVELGMSIGETWWHRDLDPAGEPAPFDEPSLAVDGGVGRLVDAPPVYAPGGPVVLTGDVAHAAALGAIEQLAAVHGATVSVVSQQPDDARRVEILESAGYKRTTDFFVWQ